MKQLPVFLTFLLLCFYIGVKSQHKIPQVTIKYDFSTNAITYDAPIKEGSPVLIQYTGVNKYAIKSTATITSGNRSYDDGLSQLQAGIQQLAGSKKKVEDDKGKNKIQIKDVMESRALLPAEPLSVMRDYLDAKANILTDIETEFTKIYQEVLKINSIMSMDKDITAAADDPTLNTKVSLEGTIFIQAGSTGISTPAGFTPTLTNSVTNINTSLTRILKLINDFKNNFNNFTNSGLNATQQQEEGPKMDELVTELQKRATALETTYSGQNLKTLQDNAADMGRRSLKLLNQDFTIAPTVIGNASGDYIEISDKLNDNAGKQLLEIKPFKINTYGGSRVDFSVGISANIGGQGKYKYDLRKNPTNATSGTAMDSVILLSDDEDRLFKFSPVIFVHWYRTTKHNLQWMLTTGLSPDFTEVSNSRLSLGSSIGFPSTNDLTKRIVLSLGVSIGYADVLKTKYKNLVDYRSFGALAATDLTEKALKVGAFFAISYNLGGIGH
jgi:hypothetical protein